MIRTSKKRITGTAGKNVENILQKNEKIMLIFSIKSQMFAKFCMVLKIQLDGFVDFEKC